MTAERQYGAASGGPWRAFIAALAVLAASGIAGCERLTRVEADFCAVVVARPGDEGRLFGRFDRFAARHGLDRRADHGPLGTHVYNSAGGASEITVDGIAPLGAPGKAEEGAIVAHHKLCGEPRPRLVAALKDFLRTEIEPEWPVRECAAADGLYPPVLYIPACR